MQLDDATKERIRALTKSHKAAGVMMPVYMWAPGLKDELQSIVNRVLGPDATDEQIRSMIEAAWARNGA